MLDVCLIVEGNYPYVTGGVSQWADRLLHDMPGVQFGVVHVRGEGEPERPMAYTPPAGTPVVHVDIERGEVVPEAGLEAALPDARVYHATCTGAASELGRRAAAQRGAGFALTEHGVAWRDIVMSPWPRSHYVRPDLMPKMSELERRRLTRDLFRLARDTYAEAGAVTSVCGPNVALQVAAGAAPERVSVIPNPVAPGPEAVGRDGFLAAYVGRVAPEKDVLGFLRACHLVAAETPDARFAVVGPLDQNEVYAEECLALTGTLGLGERVTFTGATDPAPWYARMDALVLTSKTEAQPLVALEAMAAGVPVVATDVGGCREAIGDAGLLTAPGDPRATADAMLRLAADELLRARLGRAGRRRTATTHDPRRVYGAYRELYERLAA